MDSFDKKESKAVADQDLQIKGGEGGRGHPDTEIIGGARSQKNFFALRASVWFNNKGEARAPRIPPLDPPLQGTNKRE